MKAIKDDADDVHDEAWKFGTNHKVVKLQWQVYFCDLDWVAISGVLAAYCFPLPVGTLFPGNSC